MPSPNWIHFAETDPKTAEAYRGMIRPALADGALDADMKELIYTVLVAAHGYLPGLESHIDAMMSRGIKADVIREAVRLILPSCGIAVYLPLVPVMEAAIARHEKA